MRQAIRQYFSLKGYIFLYFFLLKKYQLLWGTSPGTATRAGDICYNEIKFFILFKGYRPGKIGHEFLVPLNTRLGKTCGEVGEDGGAGVGDGEVEGG